MTDTSPEIAERYRRMLLARSGADRLEMGSSMHATAVALVRASVLARSPQASPGEVRQALFLRFYGHDYDAQTRNRIMERLGREEIAQPRATRRVPVDWDLLEAALTENSSEWIFYLDLETGGVPMVPIGSLGESVDGFSEAEAEARLDAGSRIHIRPLDSSVEYEWMAGFAGTVPDARRRRRLETGLGRSRPFRRFKDALLDNPVDRERWFAFREGRLRAAARQWLAEHGIEATTARRKRTPGALS